MIEIRNRFTGELILRVDSSDLRGADLPIFCKWPVSQVGLSDVIKIGCKEKRIAEWVLFFAGNEEYDTSRGTPEFKQIEANFKAFEAYYNHLNN